MTLDRCLDVLAWAGCGLFGEFLIHASREFAEQAAESSLDSWMERVGYDWKNAGYYRLKAACSSARMQ